MPPTRPGPCAAPHPQSRLGGARPEENEEPPPLLPDMVEMMLMQNAQLHQILMHSLMLRALPSSVFSPLGASQAAPLHPGLQVGSVGGTA